MEPKSTKVLIIEDVLLLAKVTEKMLLDFGYNVVGICDDANSALMKYRDEKPDLLLVDIDINGEMSGIDVVKKIKEDIDIPVIYLTSITDDNTLNKAKRTLPSAILSKPFDKWQLKSTIEISLHSFLELNTSLNKLKKLNETQSLHISELTETNGHLITATWRERELKQELQKTKTIAEKQHKKIMDSINYAQRIQHAIIPSEETLNDLLGNYFMIYKPKDVVSGDFPWVYEKGDFVYIAVVDCTGHGVPGAMMSLIGALILHEVVNDNEEYETPAQVLNELHAGVVATLKQDSEGNKAADGMDVAICRINRSTNEVLFSGAHRPLYHLHNGELLEYKGDKFPIGGMQYKGNNHFIDHKVEILKDDSIYFFSDGFPDQFGGPNCLKYGPRRIRELIVNHKNKSMKEMEEVFNENFDSWKSDNQQIDDVLMIGVKF